MNKFSIGLGMLLAFVTAATVSADDSALRDELADLRSKVAAMESAEMAPAAGGDAASLTSMKKKGQIQIGGDVEMDIKVIRADDNTGSVAGTARGTTDRNSSNHSDDTQDSTSFSTSDADLDFKILASQDTYLFIKLDLDDFWDATTDQDDLLEEVYFYWKNVRGSNFDVRFGKGEIPYGQDKDVAITESYHHNSGTGSLLANNTTGLAVDNGSNFNHPGELDNAFQIEGIYRWKDLVKVEMALFQDPTSRGMHEDRSDDNLFFQSYSTRVTYNPIENLALKVSYLKRHNDSQGDSTTGTNTVDANEDQNAISIAFDWKVKKMPLEVFGEYQHGWNVGNDEDRSVDIANVGIIYGVTENIDIITVAEWLEASVDGDTLGLENTESFYKGVVAGKYTFDNGIYMILEYAHEIYEREGMDDGDTREADALSFRTAWFF